MSIVKQQNTKVSDGTYIHDDGDSVFLCGVWFFNWMENDDEDGNRETLQWNEMKTTTKKYGIEVSEYNRRNTNDLLLCDNLYKR